MAYNNNHNLKLRRANGGKVMCVWVVDADRLNVNSDELSTLYANKSVEGYLSNTEKLGIVAPKGLG